MLTGLSPDAYTNYRDLRYGAGILLTTRNKNMSDWAIVPGMEQLKIHRQTNPYRLRSVGGVVPAMGGWKKLKPCDLKEKNGRYSVRNPNNGMQTNFRPATMHHSAWVTGEPPLPSRVEDEMIKRGELSL